MRDCPDLALLPLTVAIAAGAARFRGASGLSEPDAIVLASAAAADAVVLTNDRRLVGAGTDVPTLLLDELVAAP